MIIERKRFGMIIEQKNWQIRHDNRTKKEEIKGKPTRKLSSNGENENENERNLPAKQTKFACQTNEICCQTTELEDETEKNTKLLPNERGRKRNREVAPCLNIQGQKRHLLYRFTNGPGFLRRRVELSYQLLNFTWPNEFGPLFGLIQNSNFFLGIKTKTKISNILENN